MTQLSGFPYFNYFLYIYLSIFIAMIMQIWNMELMNCAQILARHEGSVTCVLASSGRVFSGAVDSMIKVHTIIIMTLLLLIIINSPLITQVWQ